MTFFPRITSTPASAAEPLEHGASAAHGAWAHAHSDDSGPHAAASASSAAAHAGPDAEQLEEPATADAPEIAHGPTTKAGKRTGRGRTDGPQSFAAELAKNVMSAAEPDDDAVVSADAELLDEQTASHTTPFEAVRDDEPGAEVAPVSPPLPHAGGLAERAAPRSAGSPGTLTGPSRASDSAPLPRAVVNGSTETPKTDAMPVSARLHAGAHVHVDGAAAPHSFAERAAPEPALIAQLTAAVEQGGADEQRTGVAPTANTQRDGRASGLPERSPATSPQAPAPRAEFVPHDSLPDSTHDRIPPGPLPEHPTASWAPVTAPIAEVQVHAARSGEPDPISPDMLPSKTLPSDALPSAMLPSETLPSETLPSKTLPPAALPLPASSSPTRSSDLHRPEPPPSGLPSPTTERGPGATVSSPPTRSPVQPVSGKPALEVAPDRPAAPAPALAVPAQAGVPRAAPLVTPPSSRSFARAGAAYAQVAADGDLAPKPVPVPGVPARAIVSQPAHPTPEPPELSAPRSASLSKGHLDAPRAQPAPAVTRPEKLSPARDELPGAHTPSTGPKPTAFQAAVAAPIASPATGPASPVVAKSTFASSAPEDHPIVATSGAPTVRRSTPPSFAPTTGSDDAPSAPASPRHAGPAHPAPSSPPIPGPDVASAAPAPSPLASSASAPSPPAGQVTPRRDVAVASVQAPAVVVQAPAAVVRAPDSSADVEVAPRVPRSGEVASRPVPLTSPAVSPSAPFAPSSPIPAGSGVTATGESTAAHPTPLVDSSSANPPLFRLSDTRRVQAAHLDLAQQSYQSGTVATSSPSTKGFDTGADLDKADKRGTDKKSRAATFAPMTSPPAPAPGQPKAPRAEDPTAPRSAPTAVRGARPVDAIHALASTGGAPSSVAPSIVAPTSAPTIAAPEGAAHRRAGVTAPERHDEPAPFADVKALAACADVPDVDSDAKRPAESSRHDVPSGDTRPAQPAAAPVGAADRTPPQPPAHAQPSAPSVPQGPASPPAAPQAPAAAQPLYDLATVDQSLHATALGQNAHLHLDAGAAGPLSLHLTVRDGVADLEIEGPAAEHLKMRPEDLRRALAGEGLALGHFASRVNETSNAQAQQEGTSARGQGEQSQGSQSHGDHRPATSEGTNQPDSAPRATATPFAAQSGASSYGGEGRRHWQGETPDSSDRDRRPGAPPSSGAAPSSSGDAATGRRRGVHVTA